jgi:hypothetical protein
VKHHTLVFTKNNLLTNEREIHVSTDSFAPPLTLPYSKMTAPHLTTHGSAQAMGMGVRQEHGVDARGCLVAVKRDVAMGMDQP